MISCKWAHEYLIPPIPNFQFRNSRLPIPFPLRILELTNRIPYPLYDGGAIGIHYYLGGYLKAGCRLTLLAMNTTRHWVDIATLPPVYKQLHRFETVKVDNRIKPVPALLNLFKSSSYHIDRFISEAFRAALVKLLNEDEYDVIHLDGIYLTPYIPMIRQHSSAKIILRLHNPEFRIWERLATQERKRLKRRYLSLLAKRLKAFELAHINDYDLVLALSEEDAAFYRAHGCKVPIYIHPFGIETGNNPANAQSEISHPKFYHLGAMDWLPNQESVDWLLQKVWPLVIAKAPEAKLYLAGRAMPQRYLDLKMQGVNISGEVEDAIAFEQDKDVLLVPLLSGGGVRIKIYRGMAAAKAVISTSIGVEGVAARDGQEILIANDDVTFAQKILSLIKEPQRITDLGKAALALVERDYDAGKLMQRLIERYDLLITGK